MSRLSQFLGKDETIKERFIFLESAVWTVPVRGEYRLTALGAGGGEHRGSSLGTDGGNTVISTPYGVVTLYGGKGAISASGGAGGDVVSTILGISGRKGGAGGGEGNPYGGLGLDLGMRVAGQTVHHLNSFGSGGYMATDKSFGFGGGGGAINNGEGGGGGGIVDNQPINLLQGDVITIAIGAKGSGNSGSGMVIFDRY